MLSQTATIQQFFGSQPVSRAFLFGSRARGESTDQSDVDILVELDSNVSLFDFARMQYELQRLIEVPVDLVSANGLSTRIKAFVDQEKILIYEKSN
jgi:predicted nucleotidyltransferase